MRNILKMLLKDSYSHVSKCVVMWPFYGLQTDHCFKYFVIFILCLAGDGVSRFWVAELMD